ncbi:hypothetical protein [Saccharopolyspora cebuensis]|uniref:Uncharacterized protein n=1 Tax=Saccharopolyspora cebuensis TaxID=418759 RepID=A0ABV4CQB2_9PSEU
MLKDPFALDEIAARTWCRPGEELLWRIGPRRGHVASDIAGRRSAPHHAGDRIAAPRLEAPDWPVPSEPVGEGRYHGDEWAHDPSIWAQARAGDPRAAAARCADGLAAGQADAWLVLSAQRLAVVVAESHAPEPAAGGWLARAKSFAENAVPGSRTEDVALTTLWEIPGSSIHHFDAVPAGREIEPQWFGLIAFHDGSVLMVRVDGKVAAESVVSAGAGVFAP